MVQVPRITVRGRDVPIHYKSKHKKEKGIIDGCDLYKTCEECKEPDCIKPDDKVW